MDAKTLEYVKTEIDRLDTLICPRLDADGLDAYQEEVYEPLLDLLLTLRSWCYRVGLDYKGRERTEIPGCNPVAVGLTDAYWHPIIVIKNEEDLR